MKKELQAEQIICFNRWSRKSFAAFNSLNRSIKIGVLELSMSLIVLPASQLHAQRTDSVSFEYELDSVAVVGSRQGSTRSLLMPTPLFERSTQEAAPLQTLESALRLSPAIDVRERGGKAVQADISVRGGSFDQTMIMLNGVPFTDVRTGHQSHSLPIDMDIISGIDVVEGTQQIGALAGSINFRTKALYERYLRAHLTGGQHGYFYGNISGAISHKQLSVMGALSLRRSDGYTTNTDFNNLNGYVRTQYNHEKAGYFDFQIGYQQRAFGANGFYSLKFPNQFEETKTGLSSLRWIKEFDTGLTLQSSLSYRLNTDRFELIKNDPKTVPFNYHRTDNYGASLEASYAWLGGKSYFCSDFTHNRILSTVLGEALAEKHAALGEDGVYYTKGGNRSTGNFSLGHSMDISNFHLAASGGIGVHPYGTTALWSALLSYKFHPAWHVEVGAHQSSRLPTFTDLYYTAKGYQGNPDLNPEYAQTYRLAARYQKGSWRASALTYFRHSRNVIDWIRSDANSDWQASQITELNTLGVELSGGYYVNQGFFRSFALSYGYVQNDKSSGEFISKYALDNMKHKAAANLQVALFPNCIWNIQASYYDREGNYVDREGKMKGYSPYVLLDSKLQYTYKSTNWYVEANNITNTKYFDYGGMLMPECWVNAGIVLTLKGL